jgi:hypothetical protein
VHNLTAPCRGSRRASNLRRRLPGLCGVAAVLAVFLVGLLQPPSSAAPVQEPAVPSKTEKKEESAQAPAKEPAAKEIPAKKTPAKESAKDAGTKSAAPSETPDVDRDEGLDSLAKRFAEVLAQQRARIAAGAAGAKTPPTPAQEKEKEDAPNDLTPPTAPESTSAGDEPGTIERLVLRRPSDLAAVPRTTCIGRLVLTGDDFVNGSLRGLQGLTVNDLSIEAAHVSSTGLQHLTSVKDLRCLRLWTPGVDDEALAHIAQLPDLEILDLEGTAIDGTGFDKLKDLSKLDMLVLGPKMSDARVAGLKDLPALRQLDLRPCTRLTPACLEHLAELTDLKTVWLPGPLRTKGKRSLRQSLPTCEVRW